MKAKRTEQIGVRLTSETKQILQEEAAKLEWSTAKLAEKILTEWTQKRDAQGAINFIQNNIQQVNVHRD